MHRCFLMFQLLFFFFFSLLVIIITKNIFSKFLLEPSWTGRRIKAVKQYANSDPFNPVTRRQGSQTGTHYNTGSYIFTFQTKKDIVLSFSILIFKITTIQLKSPYHSIIKVTNSTFPRIKKVIYILIRIWRRKT